MALLSCSWNPSLVARFRRASFRRFTCSGSIRRHHNQASLNEIGAAEVAIIFQPIITLQTSNTCHQTPSPHPSSNFNYNPPPHPKDFFHFIFFFFFFYFAISQAEFFASGLILSTILARLPRAALAGIIASAPPAQTF